MNLNKNAVAATFMGGAAILAGSGGEAYASEPVQKMIQMFELPVEKIVHRFNAATRTAITEKCALKGNVVSCDVRVMSNETLLDHSARISYSVDADSKVGISAQSLGDRKWTPDTFKYNYRPAMSGAVKGEWTNSPLAERIAGTQTILQNGAGKVAVDGNNNASICSVVPLSDNRGMYVCNHFNAGSGAVQSSITVKAAFENNTSTANPVQASRPFDFTSSDSEFQARYAQMAKDAGGVAYSAP